MSVPASPSVSVAEALAEAVAHHRSGRLAEAERLYRAILAVVPNHPDAHHNLGWVAVQSDAAESGLPHFKAALDAEPDRRQFWLSAIEALLRTDRVAEAETGLAMAAARGLTDDDFAGIAIRIGDARHAEALFAKAVEAQRDRRPEQAIAFYDQALGLRPSLSLAHLNRGVALLSLDRLDEAEASIMTALALKPDDADALYALGRTLKAAERWEEAAEAFRRAIGVSPDLEEAYGDLAAILFELGRTDLGADFCREACRRWPDKARHWRNLGIVLGRNGQGPEAVAAFEQALSLLPDDPETISSLGLALQASGQWEAANRAYRRMTAVLATTFATGHRVVGQERPVALMAYGRVGSMFLHSLMDGHPEISTLPGVYLKGWFDSRTWKRLRPDGEKGGNWKRRFAETVAREFEPMLDAASRKNVPGLPLGEARWVSASLGLTSLGPDRNQMLKVDATTFDRALRRELRACDDITAADGFRLVHRAFDQAAGRGIDAGRLLFFHIHNPGPMELGGFLGQFPQAKLLLLVRNPIQALESWMLVALGNEHDPTRSRWAACVERLGSVLNGIRPPLAGMAAESRAIRLEDIKRRPRETLPRLAEWMGVSDHSALYESTFLGQQYWGPSSASTGAISGFAPAAINLGVGRLFGPRDLIILETLFWPYCRRFGYTDLDRGTFAARLREIRPWLDEPLQFERLLHARMARPRPRLEDLEVFRRLRFLLKSCWSALERDGDYLGMISPLPLD